MNSTEKIAAFSPYIALFNLKECDIENSPLPHPNPIMLI
jgi:hypothetical protein